MVETQNVLGCTH